jgi:hypothetical protein
VIGQTTIRYLLWSMPVIYLLFKADELWPCIVWRIVLFSGTIVFIGWRVWADSQEEFKEEARIKKLEEFYEKHKDEV